jgi:hypothetical protein
MVTPATAQVRPRSRRWRIFAWVVAAVVVGLLGYFVIGPPVQRAVLKAELASEVPAARAAALPSAAAAHATWLKRVSTALGLSRPAVYSATYNVCYIDSDGEFAERYNQKCLLAYVDFYELPSQNDAVDASIRDAKSSQIGPHSSGAVWVPDYLGNAGREDVDPSTLPDTIWATLPGTSDARSATDEWMIASSIVAYAAHDGFRGRTLLQERGQTTLDPTKQYLVVPDAHPYYTKVLGCAVGRLLFCYSPLDGN